jgi:hypothetical protein
LAIKSFSRTAVVGPSWYKGGCMREKPRSRMGRTLSTLPLLLLVVAVLWARPQVRQNVLLDGNQREPFSFLLSVDTLHFPQASLNNPLTQAAASSQLRVHAHMPGQPKAEGTVAGAVRRKRGPLCMSRCMRAVWARLLHPAQCFHLCTF